MKNIRKRFLSLTMALMMILSCMATVSAADVVGSTSDGEDSAILLGSTDGDEGIMPLVETVILEGNTNSANRTFSRYGYGLTSRKYFIFVVSSNTPCKVTITHLTSGHSQVWESGSPDGIHTILYYKNGQQVGNGTWPLGNYNLKVEFSNPNAAFAFKLFTTDTPY